MEVITTAIIAAIGKMSDKAINDLYTKLKKLIGQKFGNKSEVIEAIDSVEKKPSSKNRKEVLKEEVEESKICEDEEILKVAESLIKKIRGASGGQEIINSVQQTVSGNHNITSGTGDIHVGHDEVKG